MCHLTLPSLVWIIWNLSRVHARSESRSDLKNMSDYPGGKPLSNEFQISTDVQLCPEPTVCNTFTPATSAAVERTFSN